MYLAGMLPMILEVFLGLPGCGEKKDEEEHNYQTMISTVFQCISRINESIPGMFVLI